MCATTNDDQKNTDYSTEMGHFSTEKKTNTRIDKDDVALKWPHFPIIVIASLRLKNGMQSNGIDCCYCHFFNWKTNNVH